MEPVHDQELKTFLAHTIHVLEHLKIPYMVVGGFAAIMYGEPRLTIDVDIVVDMNLSHVGPFLAAFPHPEYYASEEGIRDALARGYPFNVLHPTTGAKVDLIPLPADPFTRTAFERRQRLVYDEAGHSAMFISPEDIVLAKLLAFRWTSSEKHLRDARGILLIQWSQLDWPTLRRGAKDLGLQDVLDELLVEVRKRLQE